MRAGKYERPPPCATGLRRRGQPGRTVSVQDIAAAVSSRTAFPVGTISRTERQRLAHAGADALRPRHRAGGGRPCRGRGRAARRSGLAEQKRPAAAMLFLGADGCRQDGAVQGAGRGRLRQRGRDDPRGYVGIYGKIHGLAPYRRAAGLHRPRRGRRAVRTCAPQALQSCAVRRAGKGAPGRLRPAAAGHGGRFPDGFRAGGRIDFRATRCS